MVREVRSLLGGDVEDVPGDAPPFQIFWNDFFWVSLCSVLCGFKGYPGFCWSFPEKKAQTEFSILVFFIFACIGNLMPGGFNFGV